MRQTRFVRNVLLGIENLLLHKLRSFLTMLGVVFGVGSVVAMLSVGEGASKEALAQIRKLGSNNIIISSIKSVEDDAATTQHSHMSIYGLTYEDQHRIAESFSHIDQTAPVKVMRKEARLQERSIELRIVGTTEQWFDLVPRQILAGRVLLASDLEKKLPVAVLTEFGARKILATQNTVGEKIRIGSDYFEVVGIVRSEGGQAGNIQMPDEEVDVYIPMSVGRAYFGDIHTQSAASNFVHLQRIYLDHPTAKGRVKLFFYAHLDELA
jgi:putative ABC transport system permease protein